MFSIDQQIVLKVQTWRRPFLNRAFLYLTYTGTGKAWFVFALILNVLHFAGIALVPSQAQFLRAMFCPLLAWLVGIWVKKLFARPRPSEDIPGYLRITVSPTCGSFPSTHTSAAVAFWVGLMLGAHPWMHFVGIWAVLVSFSRLYLGVHYLTDILGGAILGTIIAVAFGLAGLL